MTEWVVSYRGTTWIRRREIVALQIEASEDERLNMKVYVVTVRLLDGSLLRVEETYSWDQASAFFRYLTNQLED